jgi:hypothetical protein
MRISQEPKGDMKKYMEMMTMEESTIHGKSGKIKNKAKRSIHHAIREDEIMEKAREDKEIKSNVYYNENELLRSQVPAPWQEISVR